MAITPKLREDGSGGAENPWATDLDGNAITVDVNGKSGTPDVQIDGSGRIAVHASANNTGAGAWASGATSFANGIIRGVLRANNDILHYVFLSARKTASNGTHVSLALNYDSAGQDQLQLRYGTKDETLATGANKTLALDTDYEAVFYFNGTAYKLLSYTAGTFPPGSDYKTISWDIETTNSGPTTQSGKPAIAHNRFETADVTAYLDNLLAWEAGESADVPTVSLAAGDSLLTVSVTGVANAYDKRATLWRFLRYKAGSQPSDENDGTLVTGAGTGLGGSAIRSDGRFIDVPADFDITGLSNGTTYYVRPFVVMADGSIVAGTADSDTPAGGDTAAPDAPTDFSAAYDDPFVASKIVLTWTNPSEAGDYKINYRTDGTDPTSSSDASATTLVDWTAYSADSAGTTSATSLTDGLRYRFAIWHRDSSSNVSTGAFVDKVSVHQITLLSPADGATGVQLQPYLIWETEAGEQEDNRSVHYRVEVSRDKSSESAFVDARVMDVSSLNDGVAGFEYEDTSGVWVALPQTGLAVADIGKNVRYQATQLTVSGLYNWRVSAQQPGA